jgi:hypothetical protein
MLPGLQELGQMIPFLGSLSWITLVLDVVGTGNDH